MTEELFKALEVGDRVRYRHPNNPERVSLGPVVESFEARSTGVCSIRVLWDETWPAGLPLPGQLVPIMHCANLGLVLKDRRQTVEAIFTHFVARALGYYGKGRTLKEAIKNMRKEGATAREKADAFWGSEDIEVLDNGTVQATQLLYLGEIQ